MTAISTPIPMPTRTRPSDVAEDVVDRLSHPTPPASEAAGPFITLFQCAISFGLLPLLLWPTRWAEFLDTERHDLLDLAAWWRSRVDATDAAKLDKITARFRHRPILVVLPWLAVGFNFVLFATLFMQGDSLNRLWKLTVEHKPVTASSMQDMTPVRDYSRAWERVNYDRAMTTPWETPASFPLEKHLYTVWMATLCLAYFCQWYAVRSHAVAVHSLVRWTNKLARENRLLRVKDESKKLGLDLFWIVLAVGLCSQDAWWAIPMVLAGSFQRRYSMQSSRMLRMGFAGQARDGLESSPVGSDRFCAIGHCGAPLPGPARFCPRCGTRA